MLQVKFIRYVALATALIVVAAVLVAASQPSQPAPAHPSQPAGPAASPPPTTVVTPTPVPTSAAEPEAARNMRIVLGRWFGESGAAASLQSARQAEWPDACFGTAYPNETCAQGTMPGWELTFVVDGAAYTFRTDPQAYRFRVTAAPPPDIGQTIVSWTGHNGAEVDNCSAAEIGTRAVAFGDCGGRRVAGRFVNQANRDLLNQNVERFASFKASTPAGAIVFTGRGSEAATPADQRAVAELAQLMAMEARGGRAAPGVNVLAHTRDAAPDRAPVCLTVDVTGRFTVTGCQPGEAPQFLRLNSGGLEEVYGWLDQLQGFEMKVTERGVTKQIAFAGRGEKPAGDADRQAILRFAEGLVADARELQPRSGMVRYALPLLLPDGLDWVPEQSAASDHSFRARAEDPANPRERWVQLHGSLEVPARPADAPVTVQLRGVEGEAYIFGKGHLVIWKEDSTHFTVSTSSSLSQTLEIAGSLQPLQLEEFDQLMRERAQPVVPTPAPAPPPTD